MTEDTIVQIPLEDLHDSPFQPRTTYTGLEGLSAAIKAEGRIHQALLVRPRIGPLFGNDPDAAAGYEIVYGHRRRRAAELAGLATAPCTVRAMSDAEVRSAQMVENVQRENMSALDEGAGFKAQVDAGDANADQIAERIGKSRSYVYGRMKLLDLAGPLRTALNSGEIGAEVALLLARLRTDKLQQKALQKIAARNQQVKDGGQESYRRIRDLLAEEFTLQLKEAIFNAEDATLLPGAGTCSACPKRAGNAPEYIDLVDDENATHKWRPRGGADSCTDPDCWAAKKTAHLQREAEKLRAAGHEVVDGNKARTAVSATGEIKGDFVPVKDMKALMKLKSVAKPPTVVMIQGQVDGKLYKAVRTADLVQAGLIEPKKKAPKKEAGREAQQARVDAERQAQIARAESVNAQRMALMHAVRGTAANRPRDEFDLRLVVAASLGGVGWQDKDTLIKLWGAASPEALTKRVDTMNVQELTTLLIDCAIVDDVQVHWAHIDHTKPKPLLALAGHYGIDAKAVMQAAVPPPAPPAQATSTPSPAGAGAKKANAAPAKVKTQARGVAYRCAATGSTWSGRGLKPAWLVVALRDGKKLDDFKVEGKTAKAMVEAGSAGKAPAGADLFAEAEA